MIVGNDFNLECNENSYQLHPNLDKMAHPGDIAYPETIGMTPQEIKKWIKKQKRKRIKK